MSEREHERELRPESPSERLDLLARSLLDPLQADARATSSERQAAVACIFLPAPELQVLLMRRAERKGDRWSGQVSFPGGHLDDRDKDLAAAARRETQEEVGLDLCDARLLGCLAPRKAKARGKPLSISITPFVFRIDHPPQLHLGPEAARAFWLPFERAGSGEFDDSYLYDAGNTRVRLPAWRHAEETIWGMTLEMLQELSRLAGE